MLWIALAGAAVVGAGVAVVRRRGNRNSGTAAARDARVGDRTNAEAEGYASLHRNQTFQSGGPF